MNKITLTNGREVTIDLGKISVRDWRRFTSDLPQDEEDALVAEWFGLSAEEMLDLSIVDYQRLFKLLKSGVTEALNDPN